MNKITILLIGSLFLVLPLASCSNMIMDITKDRSVTDTPDTLGIQDVMTSFRFLKDINPHLPEDLDPIVKDNVYLFTVPYGTEISNMKASFDLGTGYSVIDSSITLESGQTSYNYSSSYHSFVVENEDQSISIGFTVKVKIEVLNKEQIRNSHPKLFNLDVSKVTDMSDLGIKDFDSSTSDVTEWDVSNVTNMNSMFYRASSFNQDLSGWDVSNVTDMDSMFCYAYSFDQDLSGWDVSNVESMWFMFCTSSFNQDLSRWDVSNVRDMGGMFYDTPSFNQDLSGWDVSNVTNMQSMFCYAYSFNQDLSGWDVSNVTSMRSMFYNASFFNQDLSGWDVSNVTNMQSMFQGASSFNQDLSGWDVTNVTNYPFFEDGSGLSNEYCPKWGD